MKAIGLMSGTSMDGIDVALIETDGEAVHAFGPACAYPYSAAERHLLREAMVAGRGLTARDARGGVLALAESMVTSKHADCVQAFAEAYGIKLSSVDVIGFHGQTVLHRPEQQLTVQLGDGWGLERGARCSRRLRFPRRGYGKWRPGRAAGAGLSPRPRLARGPALPAAFVNIGGIANVTFVPEGPAEGLIAFDAGPGNCLIDDWALRHTGEPMDRDAKLAMAGKVDRQTLAALISHPYFKEPAPKSLDRGTFALDLIGELSPEDGAATLTAFTVAGIAAAAHQLPAHPRIWIVTGGGARNPHMFEGLRRVLGVNTVTADEAGFSTDFMEAQAFAYLAARRMKELPSTFAGTTGVSEPAICGLSANANSPQPSLAGARL